MIKINQQDQRTIIAKFREVAEASVSETAWRAIGLVTVEHERIRKTKAHPFEENHYRLKFNGKTVAKVSTGADGIIARWRSNLTAILTGQATA